jgi:hypothetical protein
MAKDLHNRWISFCAAGHSRIHFVRKEDGFSAIFDPQVYEKKPKAEVHTVRPGIHPHSALHQAVTREKTRLGCTSTIGMVVVLGICNAAREYKSGFDRNYRLDTDSTFNIASPHRLYTNNAWIVDIHNVPDDNWIPGDWGYWREELANNEVGGEGHNTIYVGERQFKLWGYLEDDTMIVEGMYKPKLSSIRKVPSPKLFE